MMLDMSLIVSLNSDGPSKGNENSMVALYVVAIKRHVWYWAMMLDMSLTVSFDRDWSEVGQDGLHRQGLGDLRNKGKAIAL